MIKLNHYFVLCYLLNATRSDGRAVDDATRADGDDDDNGKRQDWVVNVTTEELWGVKGGFSSNNSYNIMVNRALTGSPYNRTNTLW